MFEFSREIAREEPDRFTPMGSVWLQEYAGEEWEVRRVGEADLLTTGIALRAASETDGPHLRAPAAWDRVDDELWIATPRPAGRPLADTPSRLSWAEALELWRPLADAVTGAHRRGVIHGQLHPWSVFFDEGSGRLCATETSTWLLGEIPEGVWWPQELQCNAALRLGTPQTDVNQLARLLLWLHLPAGEAESNPPNMEGVPAYAIGALRRALSPDIDARPVTISELVAQVSSSRSHAIQMVGSAEETRSTLFGRVSEVESMEHDSFGRGVRFVLHHPVFADHGGPAGSESTGAFFYEKTGGSVFASVANVWDGAELSILDGRVVARSDGEEFITAGPTTLPVLEPHWPVSVSNVVAAQGCVNRRFVDLRDNGDANIYLVQGILLHDMLDALADDPDAAFDDVWDERAPSLRLMMLAAGLDEAAVKRMREDAKRHFVNIAGFARGKGGEHGRVGWTGKNVEVTRYSALYGLEGRIDLVTEDDRDGLQIIELKSGAVRQSHNDQVQCYQLLWGAVSERLESPLSGRILYSRDGLMRTTENDPERARRLLLTRNGIVAAHRGFWDARVDVRPPAYMEIPPACNACGFRRARCKEQSEVLGLGSFADIDAATGDGGGWAGIAPHVVERAWAYWRHFVMLIESEHWNETAELGTVLERGRLEERIQHHRAIAGLSVGDVDPLTQRITFTGDVPRIFSTGDQLVAHRGDFEGSHILEGRCVAITPDSITLKTRGAPSATSLAQDGWILDVLPARIGYRSAHRSLYRFLRQRSPQKLSALMTPENSQPASPSASCPAELNDSQAAAFAAATSGATTTLVQGPPGTGKTTVIAHVTKALVERGERVLLVAQTNTAVDTMLERLVEVGETRILRVGEANRSAGLAMALRDAGASPADHFTDRLEAELDDLTELRKAIDTAPVVGATTYRAVSHSTFDILRQRWGSEPFDVVIVDEATQIPEPMVLAAIAMAKRIVLVGDHRQLPPIVKGEAAHSVMVEGVRAPSPATIVESTLPQLDLFSAAATKSVEEPPQKHDDPMHLGGLDRSLFERLVACGVQPVLLTEQYRMNRAIMAFSNAMFYDGRLTAHSSVAERGLVWEARGDRFDELFGGSPVGFVDVDGKDTGRVNMAEAEALVATVEALLARAPGTSVGVVSPYRAQVRLIRRLLDAKLDAAAAEVDVDTVERYQGSERDVIVVSLVKTERPGDFLADARRLNVTLTRARLKVLLFGSKACLEKSPLYRALLEQPETSNYAWSEE